MQANKNSLELLEEQVIDKIGNPVSIMVVRAALESMGIRESDVYEDYKCNSLSDLSLLIYYKVKNKNPKFVLNANEKKPKKVNKSIPVSDYLWVKTKLFAKYYPLGIFHLMPVFIQIASIIIYGYSLWTYMGFNIIQSTSVVFGVILGIVISGGYVQMLGRQAAFYWNHEEYVKTKMISYKLIKAGVKGMAVIFALLFALNWILALYPIEFTLVTIVYAFLIGLLLLVMAPFHAIKQRWVISVVITLASIVALLLHFFTLLHVYISQWFGIVLAIGLTLLYLKLFFQNKIKHPSIEVEEPKGLIVVYKNYPYFFYGFLIYIFIFIDRFLAWSADINLTFRYLFLYEKSYEIGMDLSIVVFFMLVGVMEYAIASFTKFMDFKQKTTLLININSFGKQLFKIYKKHVYILFFTLIFIGFLLYFFITSSWGYTASFGKKIDVLSIKVCIIGGLGYFFLSWGMLNALYMFTLNRPNQILKALIISCVTNFLVGFFMSRWISYEYSVFGMLVGSIVFMLLTTKYVKKYLIELDFHYYAAY